jgi:hypothetical protein
VAEPHVRDPYASAAHDAVLISELRDLQGRRDVGLRFLADLRARYPRHRNFLAELKALAPAE